MVRIYGVSTQTAADNPGANKVSENVLTATTNGTQPKRMTSDGTGAETAKNILIVNPNTSKLFELNILARTGAPNLFTAAWDIGFLAKKGTSNESTSIETFFPVNAFADQEAEDFSVEVIENPSLGGISIICKGKDGYNSVNWIARVSATEV